MRRLIAVSAALLVAIGALVVLVSSRPVPSEQEVSGGRPRTTGASHGASPRPHPATEPGRASAPRTPTTRETADAGAPPADADVKSSEAAREIIIDRLMRHWPPDHIGKDPCIVHAEVTMGWPPDDVLRQVDREVARDGTDRWMSDRPTVWIGSLETAVVAYRAASHVPVSAYEAWIEYQHDDGQWWGAKIRGFGTEAGNVMWMTEDHVAVYPEECPQHEEP